MTPTSRSKRSLLKTTPERSRLMGRVRHANTEPEITLRQALFRAGLRYRIKAKVRLPGSPDLVFPRARVVIFVDGCFWHGCPVHGTWPKTNRNFWASKIKRNRDRDRAADRALRVLGWYPVRIWEHAIRNELARCVARLNRKVRSSERTTRKRVTV